MYPFKYQKDLVENRHFQCTRTHYLYTRFWLCPHDDLDSDLLVSPRFVHCIWIASSGKPRPAWIDPECHAPFSVATYLIHVLEIELHKCQDTYADMPQNRAVAKKLLACTKAILPPSIPQENVSGVIWEVKTPLTSLHKAQVMLAHVKWIHHLDYWHL
ncbi:hypothetical protein K438DRAFT_1762053 [Mycena galopus ATCC 62051]|nr:hypothetical protein K438DRAFT_1762053 [Mycena galopus ATCC 62051]